MPLTNLARRGYRRSQFRIQGSGVKLVRRRRLPAKDVCRSVAVPANFAMMAERKCYRSSAIATRAKTILDMIKDKPEIPVTTLMPNKSTEKGNNNSKPDYIDGLYTRHYSMTSSIFDTFCESQTTYNSHHLANLEPNKLKEALFNESTFDRNITKHNNVINPRIDVNLMCNEIMTPDSPLGLEVQLNTNVTCENSPHDFDSDDSVRDKDYCPSDSPGSPMSDASEKLIKRRKYRPQTYLSMDVTNNLTFDNLQTLKRGRRHSVGATCCEKSMSERPFYRKRSSTVDGNYCCKVPVDYKDNNNFTPSEKQALKRCRRNSIGPTSFTKSSSGRPCLRKRCNSVDGNYCSTLPDITEPPRKRKKYDTSLQQRKLDAKNEKINKHSVKPGCNEKCYKKCMSLLNEEERKTINKAYWDMSWQEQHAFVDAHTFVAVPKRKITSQPKRQPKRSFTFKKQDGTKIEVCKVFFLTTLGYLKVNDRILHRTFSDPSTDKRGKHQKTPKFDRNLLTQHVESFNPLEPHYRREHAPLRRYLPSDISITQMYKHFCDTYPDKHISYSLYRSHVKNMNISFSNLGNEECELCEAYNFHKKEKSHDATSQLIEECTDCVNWVQHHQRYTKARELYAAHKDEPQNRSQIFFSADLEKVIMLPRLETFKAAIFCQRLVAYNQTFAPLGKITTECKPLTVIWHDGVAGRKQEDIMSAFYQFLLRNRDIEQVHMWLDNCSAQNKNWLLYSMLIHMINSDDIAIKKIMLHYFEPGHTFMSSDQVHHQVELAMKKKGKLYDFTDFEECVSSINNSKVIVQSMSPENFLNVPNYVSQRRIQTSNPRAYLKNMVEVCFTRDSYDLIYKNNYEDTAYISLRFMNDKYLKNPRIMIFEFRTEPKCIEPKRKADILEKLSSIMPPHKLLFWKKLPIKENVRAGTSLE